MLPLWGAPLDLGSLKSVVRSHRNRPQIIRVPEGMGLTSAPAFDRMAAASGASVPARGFGLSLRRRTGGALRGPSRPEMGRAAGPLPPSAARPRSTSVPNPPTSGSRQSRADPHLRRSAQVRIRQPGRCRRDPPVRGVVRRPKRGARECPLPGPGRWGREEAARDPRGRLSAPHRCRGLNSEGKWSEDEREDPHPVCSGGGGRGLDGDPGSGAGRIPDPMPGGQRVRQRDGDQMAKRRSGTNSSFNTRR